jgi:hypothetical protein
MRQSNWRLQPYNGHSNWYTWNVALWLGNEEPLYREAQSKVRELEKKDWSRTRKLLAFRGFLRRMFADGTPDHPHTKRANFSAIAADFYAEEAGFDDTVNPHGLYGTGWAR